MALFRSLNAAKNRGCVPKSFLSSLKITLDIIKVKQRENILSGFRASGIYPLNMQEFLKRLPDFKTGNNTFEIAGAVKDCLKTPCFGNVNEIQKN